MPKPKIKMSLAQMQSRVDTHLPTTLEEANLTPTELLVLKAAVKGLMDKEIAALLKRSPRTIEQHMKNVMRKFGLRSRYRLGFHLSARGLIKL